MKIVRFVPQPPPSFTMMFTQHEGWALVMALNDAFDKHREAADRDLWRQWAKELRAELLR